MKRLIINADDFGMTAGINRAVNEAQSRGALTSTTLMVLGNAVSEAIHMTRAMPRVSVGCHVVLMHGSPVSAAGEVRSLVRGSHFRATFSKFALAAITGQLSATEIEAEVRAQITRLRLSGIVVSHLDTHKHAHAFPSVFRPLLSAARKAGVRAVRNPYEPEFSTSLAVAGGKRLRQSAVRALAAFSGRFRAAAQEAGLRTTDGTLGISATSRWSRQWVETLIAAIPEGTWELICHPAYPDEAFQRFSSAGDAGTVELEALTSEWLREAMERAGIELISYQQL